jgi:hypothetical protein
MAANVSANNAALLRTKNRQSSCEAKVLSEAFHSIGFLNSVVVCRVICSLAQKSFYRFKSPVAATTVQTRNCHETEEGRCPTNLEEQEKKMIAKQCLNMFW